MSAFALQILFYIPCFCFVFTFFTLNNPNFLSFFAYLFVSRGVFNMEADMKCGMGTVVYVNCRFRSCSGG